jgi:hypothetical protein
LRTWQRRVASARGCEHRRRGNLRRGLRDSMVMGHRVPHTRVACANDSGIRCPMRSQCRMRNRSCNDRGIGNDFDHGIARRRTDCGARRGATRLRRSGFAIK